MVGQTVVPGNDWLVAQRPIGVPTWSLVSAWPEQRDAESDAEARAETSLGFLHAVFRRSTTYSTAADVTVEEER